MLFICIFYFVMYHHLLRYTLNIINFSQCVEKRQYVHWQKYHLRNYALYFKNESEFHCWNRKFIDYFTVIFIFIAKYNFFNVHSNIFLTKTIVYTFYLYWLLELEAFLATAYGSMNAKRKKKKKLTSSHWTW